MSKTDYPLNLIEAVVFDVDGVLSPSTVPMDSDGMPLRMVNIKDGYAIQHAAKCGLQMAIISGGNSESVRQRYNMLGIQDVFLGAGKKLDVLRKWMEEKGLQPEQVAFCGNDIPDIPSLRYVGLSVCPADAASEVREVSRYITAANGGYGVARELLEQIMRVRGQWMHDADAFGW